MRPHRPHSASSLVDFKVSELQTKNKKIKEYFLICHYRYTVSVVIMKKKTLTRPENRKNALAYTSPELVMLFLFN